MDVQEHLEHRLGHPSDDSGQRHVLLEVLSNQLDFMAASSLNSIGIIIGEEMAIHVFSLQVGSVVASYYAIGVDNRHNPPLKYLPQLMGKYIPG